MTHDCPFNPPEPLASAIEPFARGFGLNESAATLLLLQVLGAIKANSIRSLSPDMVYCTPGFDIAAIDEGRALVHGALLSALQGVRDEVVNSTCAHDTADRRKWIEKMGRVQLHNNELGFEIEKKVKRIDELRAGPQISLESETPLSGFKSPPWLEILELEAALVTLREDQAKVQRDLVDLFLAISPSVIREGVDWRSFPEAGHDSFDNHFLQIATAASLITETSSTSNRLKACAELLQRSRSESPITGFEMHDNHYRACLHLSGTSDQFAALLHHARIKNSGLLNSLVFCECDADEPPDGDAHVTFMSHKWHDFMAAQLRLRATGLQTNLGLDREGLTSYIAFHEWCRRFNVQLPVEQRIHFLRWPELMIRIATSLASIEGMTDDGVLEVRFVHSATALLKEHAEHQATVLGRLMGQRVTEARLDEQVEKLVARLRAKGPQTKRDLARGINGQCYNVIDARLFEAIRRGLVVQGDGGYWAAAVSVNASTEPPATENGGSVAA